MLEICIKLLIYWGATLALSLIFIVIGMVVYATNSNRKDYVNERWGIKYFFSGVKNSGRESLILLFLLVPVLNLLLAFMAMLALCTDIGDEWQ